MFGGHCKQNEFIVNGQRVIGPQASNDFGIPREGSHNQMDELFTELHLPREYAFALGIRPASRSLRARQLLAHGWHQ